MRYTAEEDLQIIEAQNKAKKEGNTRDPWQTLSKTLNHSADSIRKHAMNTLGVENVRPNIQSKANNIPLEEKLLKYMATKKSNKVNLLEICNYLNIAPNKIQAAVRIMREKAINIEIINGTLELSGTIKKEADLKIDAASFFSANGRTFKIAGTGDLHINSRYERLDALEAFYDICENEGVTKVFQAGNGIDGEAPFNKYDIVVSGIEGQCARFVEKMPQRKNIITEFITGDDHEGWYVQQAHINIGKYMQRVAEEAGRFDLKYLGHMERDIVLKGAKTNEVLRIIHAGGGSAYATSYTSQKYVESLGAGEKPKICLVGHFHKFEYCYPREVHMVQVGCFEDQTPFMRKKRLQAMVGGTILTIHLNCDGMIDRVQVEWIPFYGKKFYANPLIRKTTVNNFEYQW